MSGWTIVKDKGIRLEHLSTSSLIKLTVDQENSIYLEYSEFDALKRCIEQIEPILPQSPTKELRDARAMLSGSCILIDNTKGDAYDLPDVDLIKDHLRQRGVVSINVTILCGVEQAKVLLRIIAQLSDGDKSFRFMKNGIKYNMIPVPDLPDWRMVIVPEPII